MNNYYVYIYLDPRKSGEYVYGDYKFDYEPFYVGKGKENRYLEHLRPSRLNRGVNLIKENKLKKILSLGLTPIIVKIKEALTQEDSLLFEKELIEIIGRITKKSGPLTNMSDGGDGNSRVVSDSFRLAQSFRMKKYYDENPITKNICEKISKTLLAKKMVRSEETKNKISNANKNRVYSDEYLERMKIIRKGPKLTHRKKYILINPNKIIFEFLGKEEMVKFVHENNLSERKILTSINKGVITINDVRLTKNTENIKTKNCIGWEVKKIINLINPETEWSEVYELMFNKYGQNK